MYNFSGHSTGIGEMKKKKPFFEKVLQDLFYEYKEKMRLNKHWAIKIKIEAVKEDYARCDYDFKQKVFDITISDKVNKSVHALKDTVIHEFWHVLLSSLTSKYDNILDQIDQGKPIDTTAIRKSLALEEERLVRKFTQIILSIERKSHERR